VKTHYLQLIFIGLYCYGMNCLTSLATNRCSFYGYHSFLVIFLYWLYLTFKVYK